MTLLAIDSSTQAMGLALYDGHRVLYELAWGQGGLHTVELAPAIQTALDRAGLKMGAVQALGVAIGPGSYTGLRIGLALAKGLALAGRRPLVAVPTLEILAAAQRVEDKPLAAVLQAGRGRLAVGWFAAEDGRWAVQGETQLISIEDLSDAISKPTLICGELYEEERRILARKHVNAEVQPPAHSLRRPAVLAELAWERWQAGEVAELAGLGPIYAQSSEQPHA